MIRKLLLIGFLLFILIPQISSFEFDNKLTYYNEDLKVELTNWFGLGVDYGTVELKSHKSVDEVRDVAIGKDRVVMYYDFDFLELYEEGLGKVYFTDERTGEEIEKNYSFVYWTNETYEKNIYEEQCSESFNGTNICGTIVIGKENATREIWKPYNSRDIQEGKIRIGLQTDVKFNDIIDGVWTIGGKKIERHAIWGASNGLVSYYKLDESSGSTAFDEMFLNNLTNVGMTVNQDGILNKSYLGANNAQASKVTGFDFNNDHTVSLWANLTSHATVSAYYQGGSTNLYYLITQTDGSIIIVLGGRPSAPTTPAGVIQNNQWQNIVVTRDGNNWEIWVDGINKENHTESQTITTNGFFQLANNDGNEATRGLTGRIDEVGVWNRTLSSDEIIQLYNERNACEFGNELCTVNIDITLNSPIDNFNSTSQTIDFNGTIFSETGNAIVNVSLIINNTYNETNTSGINNTDYLFTKILSDGFYNWMYESCDDSSSCINATFRNLFIDTIFPTINLTSPTGEINSHSIGDSLFLNWSVVDANLDSCWFNYDGTNTTVTCNDNTTTFNTVEDEQNLTFYANDTIGNENSSVTSWTYAFLETGVEFDFNVSETSNQSFEINVTTDINVLSISAILTYNGTNFTSTASCDSGNCTISNLIDIPLIISGEFENKSFLWNLAIFNGTSSSSIQTTTRIQNVSKIHLESCNATFPTQTLNFTVYDEQTLDRISPFSFDGDFDLWIGSGNVMRNNSISENATDVELCLSPNVTIITDAIIDYDSSTLTNYTNRFYYFDEKPIDNSSEDIFMYLLQSASSTSFILKVQDESLLPVTDAIIEIHRFYPGTGEFRIVQIARTDDNGKSIGFFETETVDYKFIIKKDGVTLLETGQQKVVPETSPFTLTFNTGDPLDEPWASQEELEEFNSTLIWNDTSEFVTYVYIDTSGNFTLARLLVIKESLVNSTNDTTICEETSALTSATLSCNVGSTNGFYVASSFITRDSTETLDEQKTFQIETLSGVVGLLGLFYGWFLVLIASFMFKFNEIAGIWAVTITVFLINLFGLINFGGVFVTGTIAVALILTWIMEKP